MDVNSKWVLIPAHFGPLWPYVEDDEITDIDFNGTDLWITNTINERTRIEDHEITKEFIEKFSHYVANNVSKPFNKVDNLLEADTDTLHISIVHETSAISGRSVCIRKTLPKKISTGLHHHRTFIGMGTVPLMLKVLTGLWMYQPGYTMDLCQSASYKAV